MLKLARKPKAAKKSAKSKFVLMLGDEGAILVLIEGSTVTRRLFAANTEKEQVAAFLDLFAEFDTTPIYCLVDMMDQSYVRHTLPPVTSIGLKKIINRRLERDFPKDDLKGSIAIGRETSGRKDWHVLLISLAYNDALKKWLDIVFDLPNRLMGIYLLPVECERIIAKINQAVFPEEKSAKKTKPKGKKGKNEEAPLIEHSKWKMLVSHHKVGGVRQVVLKEGKLVFTRLAQAGANENPELTAGNIEQEMQNTVEYLKRLGFNEKAGLDVFIAVSQEIKEHISGQRLTARNLKLFTPFELSETLGLDQAALSADRFGDVVIATTFGVSQKPRLKLSLPIADKLEKLFMARMGVHIAAVLISLACIGMLINSGISYFSQSTELEDYTRKAANKRNELEEFKKELEKLPANINEINDVVALNRLITGNTEDPLKLVSLIQPLLDEHYLVSSLSWKYNHATKTPETQALPPMHIKMDLRATYNGEKWKTFVENTNKKIDELAALFPRYKMKRGFLPGQVGELDPVTLSISGDSEDPTAAKKGDFYTVLIEFTGPDETIPVDSPPAAVPLQ